MNIERIKGSHSCSSIITCGWLKFKKILGNLPSHALLVCFNFLKLYVNQNPLLEFILANYDETKVQGYDEVLASLSGLGGYAMNPLKWGNHLNNKKIHPLKPSRRNNQSLSWKLYLLIFDIHSWEKITLLHIKVATDLIYWQVNFSFLRV